MANQCAIVWNFVLTDTLVFGDRRRRRLPGRFARFAALNNVDLIARVPMLAILVGEFGLGYLTATVLTLCIMAVARFAVLDRLIYVRARDVRPPALDAVSDGPQASPRSGPPASGCRDAATGRSAGVDPALDPDRVGCWPQCSCSVWSARPRAPSPRRNLLVNGDLEAVAGDFPICWERSGWGEDEFTFALTDAGAQWHDGDVDHPYHGAQR